MASIDQIAVVVAVLVLPLARKWHDFVPSSRAFPLRLLFRTFGELRGTAEGSREPLQG